MRVNFNRHVHHLRSLTDATETEYLHFSGWDKLPATANFDIFVCHYTIHNHAAEPPKYRSGFALSSGDCEYPNGVAILFDRPVEQHDGVRRHRLTAPYGVTAFVGPGLDVDAAAEDRVKEAPHRRFKRLERRSLGKDGNIRVHQGVSRSRYIRVNLLQKNPAGGVFPLGIGIGEVLADIAPPHRSQQRIDQGMNRDIPVAVSDGAQVIGDLHAREHEFAAGLETVKIVAVADTEWHDVLLP
jgi:hypothetical protein